MNLEYKNQEIDQWLSAHNVSLPEKSAMVEKVEKVSSVWYIAEVDPNEDMDAYNPLYGGQSERVKQLKKKKIWILINPVYRIYANVKVRIILFCRTDKKVFFTTTKKRIQNKWKNRKSVIRRRNRAFLKKLRYSPEKIKEQQETVFKEPVKFSVIVPLFNTPERYLRDMIESVLNQTYSNLELCLGDASDAEHIETVAGICNEYAAADKRVRYKKLEKNAGIAENTNRCIEMASGDYIALLDHDDMYHEGALFACMERIEKEGAEFIYTDEMTFEKDKIENIVTLHFKPDFSMQNLKGVNYICHLCAFKKSLLEKTGMFDDRYNGSQDHDIILKLTSAAKKVSHIPEILYFWRVHPQSVSMNINAKSYAIDAGKAAVRDNEKRAGRDAEVFSSCICATHYRLEYQLEKEEMISIIIANQNNGTALAKLIDSIKKRTTYKNYEIEIVDFGSTEEAALEYLKLIGQEDDISVMTSNGASISAVLNRAVENAKGAYVVFLESNMEILKASWLHRMVSYAMQKDIGVVGQRMMNSFGLLEEAGYIAGLGKDGVALPIEYGNDYAALGYMGRMYYVHNVSLVSLWGMMVKTEEFKQLGGLDEALQTRQAGFDFCLKELERGRQVVLDPYVLNLRYKKPLENLETEEAFFADAAAIKARWQDFFAKGDPYYNKHFAKDGSFTYDYLDNTEEQAG